MTAAGRPAARAQARHVVGRVEDIPEGGRMIVEIQGRSIGVFNVGGQLRAVLNTCPHQGAPLCHGPVVPEIRSERPGEVSFETGRMFLQCPWHRWEFDLETGQSWFDPRTRARPIPVGVEHGCDLGEGGAAPAASPVLREATVPGTVHGTVLPEERFPGPYRAELVEVSVEHDYVVVQFGK